MSKIGDEIIELLNNDIVSRGFLVQCIEQNKIAAISQTPNVNDVLEELLISGKVEIGIAKMSNPNYVEFVAWKGTVSKRLSRAIETTYNVSTPDREFAYWLCLRENVDSYEDIPRSPH